jgi:hypothetical protein
MRHRFAIAIHRVAGRPRNPASVRPPWRPHAHLLPVQPRANCGRPLHDARTGGVQLGWHRRRCRSLRSHPLSYQPRRRLRFSSHSGGNGIPSGSAGRHPPTRSALRRDKSTWPGELGARQPGNLCCCCCCPGCCCCDWQHGSCWRCCSNCRRVSRGSSPVDETPVDCRLPIDDCRLSLLRISRHGGRPSIAGFGGTGSVPSVSPT